MKELLMKTLTKLLIASLILAIASVLIQTPVMTISKSGFDMPRKRLPFSISDEAILAIDAIPPSYF